MNLFADPAVARQLLAPLERCIPLSKRQRCQEISNAERSHRTERLRLLLGEVYTESFATTTRMVYDSHGRYFNEFCAVVGLDPLRFGAVVGLGGISRHDEERVLALYAMYVVTFPRISGEDHNSANYAECSVSALRDRVYERYCRVPGGPPAECRFLRKVFKSLHKRAPSGERAFRPPVLQDAMRAVRARLDLGGSGYDRVLWALWLTQWQGVKR